jgi:hypothetical protein
LPGPRESEHGASSTSVVTESAALAEAPPAPSDERRLILPPIIASPVTMNRVDQGAGPLDVLVDVAQPGCSLREVGSPPSARSGSPIPPDRTSVIVAPSTHGTSHRSKHHQDQADNHEDNPDAPQNGNLCDESDYQQDDAKDDHLLLLAVI